MLFGTHLIEDDSSSIQNHQVNNNSNNNNDDDDNNNNKNHHHQLSKEMVSRLSSHQQNLVTELIRTRERLLQEITYAQKMGAVIENSMIRDTIDVPWSKLGLLNDDDNNNNNNNNSINFPKVIQPVGNFFEPKPVDDTSSTPKLLIPVRPSTREPQDKTKNKNSKNKNNNNNNNNNNLLNPKMVKMDLLPVLTNTGEPAFEIGLDETLEINEKTGEIHHVLPIFKLPRVNPNTNGNNNKNQKFINRLPRNDSYGEKQAKNRESKELEKMRIVLGISHQELKELELLIAKATSQTDPITGVKITGNEINKFMQLQIQKKQYAMGAYNILPRISNNNKNNNNNPFQQIQIDTSILVTGTPRCLQTGIQSNPEELTMELHRSIASMKAYQEAVKSDVLEISKFCPVKGGERAAKFLKLWSAQRLGKCLVNVTLSVQFAALQRWKSHCNWMKKQDIIIGYCRYQATCRISQLWYDFYLFKLKAPFQLMKSVYLKHKANLKQNNMLRCSILVQKTFRMSVQYRRFKVKLLEHRKKRAFKMAQYIQARVRGMITRRHVNDILDTRNKKFAATKIQCMTRKYIAIGVFIERRKYCSRIKTAIFVQSHYRRWKAYQRFEKLIEDKFIYDCIVDIQRVWRGIWGREKYQIRYNEHLQAMAAAQIQKIIRGFNARRRVERYKWEKGKRVRVMTKAALKIQSIARGKKARSFYNLKQRERKKALALTHRAATKIQKICRGWKDRRRVKKKKDIIFQFMCEDAKLWVETWSEDNNAYFYYNQKPRRGQPDCLWQPPATGYVKQSGLLVIADGRVMEDPFAPISAEELERMRKEKLCSNCETKPCTRKCLGDGCDRYCGSCYKTIHRAPNLKNHTFEQIGPMECSECEDALAIKFCHECDDPFCHDCHSKLHAKGKRRKHKYREVTKDGEIGDVIHTYNGKIFESGSVYTPTELFNKLDADNDNNDSYSNDDYKKAKMLGPENKFENWTQYADEEGFDYWYNNITGDTTYVNPQRYISENMGGYDSLDNSNESYDYQDDNKWEEYEDEHGNLYWYNPITGETTYTNPWNTQDEENLASYTGDGYDQADLLLEEEEVEEVDEGPERGTLEYYLNDDDDPIDGDDDDDAMLWYERYSWNHEIYWYRNGQTGEITEEKPDQESNQDIIIISKVKAKKKKGFLSKVKDSSSKIKRIDVKGNIKNLKNIKAPDVKSIKQNAKKKLDKLEGNGAKGLTSGAKGLTSGFKSLQNKVKEFKGDDLEV